MLERVTVDPDYRVIYGKPDTPRGVSPVWEAAPGNLLVKASKALGAYLILIAFLKAKAGNDAAWDGDLRFRAEYC